MRLSKTSYLIWRECPHNAWLKVHRPDLYNAVPLSAFDETIIEAGNEVDVLARDLFPGGVTIERGDAAGTAKLVAAKTPVLYQPVFVTDRFTTACDILVWNALTASYDLYEVKASTDAGDKRAKDDLYTHDIAFQALVLRENGVPLGRLHLARLAGDYVRGEQLDVARLFVREDFTQRVSEISAAVALEMDSAHDVLASREPLPAPCGCILKGRSSHCTTFAITNPDVPAYSVHDITRIGSSKRKLAELVERGILRIEDVPEDFPLSDAQANQVRAAQTRRPMIDRATIAEFLSALRFPLAFLDYETFAAAVPRFPGYRPFDHIPFQFSLDVLPSPAADLEHHEFLHMGADDPDRPLLAALAAALPAKGSIIVWNDTFERGINDRLAARNPDYAEWLADADVRIVDLMDVFTMQAYVHPGFRGRTSIKSVLPVLVPGFSYKSLAIQEGATATARWNEVVTGAADPEAADRVRADLLAYCGLDTRAMVEIWRALEREVQPIRRAV